MDNLVNFNKVAILLMGAPDLEQITKIINVMPESKPYWQIITASIAAIGAIITAWIGIRRKK